MRDAPCRAFATGNQAHHHVWARCGRGLCGNRTEGHSVGSPRRMAAHEYVPYTDRTVTVVRDGHFASQDVNIPNWLDQNGHPRARLMAREAITFALMLARLSAR